MSESIYTIYRIGKQGHIKWQPNQKELICKLYQEGNSINSISKLFDNLHYQTIKSILCENNINIRTRSQAKIVYTKNSRYFSNIDSFEKAYWLGALSADGFCGLNLDKTGTNIISLVSKDKDFVEKFSWAIQIEKEPTYLEYSDCWQCRFQDKQMAEDLASLGIYNNKSLMLQPPHISTEYDYHWIRGYFDGDGGISFTDKARNPQMYFTGTKEVLQWIQKHFYSNVSIRQEHRCVNNTYRLQYGGFGTCYQMFQLMYKGSTENMRMNRKYNLFLKALNGRSN